MRHELLLDILTQAAAASPALSADDLIRSVIPPDPAVLLETALEMGKRSSAEPEDASKFLLAALKILDAGGPLTSKEWVLKAKIQSQLQRPGDAADSYAKALALEPRHAGWRLEYCRCLADAGRFRDAHGELMALQAPSSALVAKSKELLDTVNAILTHEPDTGIDKK